MLQYILECIAFQMLFLAIYDFLLKRETFFQWNRVYLLATYVFSMLLPWVKIEAFKQQVPQDFAPYPEFWLKLQKQEIEAITTDEPLFQLSWQEGVLYAGMLMAGVLFLFKLHQLYRLKMQSKKVRYADFTQIIISDSSVAFSFFRSIFLGDKVIAKNHESIIAHELVHIQQGHTWDLLFFELMRIIGWFNPLVYNYQNRTSELHEFIADAQVSKEQKPAHYQQLLSQVFQTEHISFINQFFTKSLIKKRIVMLQKSKSKKVWQLKYLLLIPMVVGMLVYTSCEFETSEIFNQLHQSVEVEDIENISLEQQKLLFNQLVGLSEQANDWSMIITDKNSTITFTKAPIGSGISGLNGRLINAKMNIESKVLNKDYSLFMYEDDLEKKSKLEYKTIPFVSADQVPIFPGCENVDDKRACFNNQIQMHISKNFNYPLEAQAAGIQGRVSVMFIITADGTIDNIAMRGPDKLLEDEVERIIKRLPKMTPGEHKGVAANVPFSIPVNFKLE